VSDVVREREKEQNNREPSSQAAIAPVEPGQTEQSENRQRGIHQNVGRIERLVF